MSISIKFKCKNNKMSSIKANLIEEELIKLERKFEYKYIKYGKFKYQLDFYPFSTLYISIDENILYGEVDTSIIGPGLHNHIINLIEEFISNLNLSIEIIDTLNYWDNRDFKLLQESFRSLLEENIKVMIENNQTLYWPFDWFPVDLNGIVTHMGHYETEDLKNILNSSIEEFSKNFYIWYNLEKDEYYYLNLAIYQMNCLFAWVKPRNESEQSLTRDILKNIDIAYKLNKNIKLPHQEISEINSLLSDEEIVSKITDTKLMGYRREKVYQTVFKYFNVTVPGNLECIVDNDVVSFLDNDIKVDIKISNQENAKVNINDKSKRDLERLITYENETHKYTGKYYLEELSNLWCLDGEISFLNLICSVNIKSKNYYDNETVYEIFANLNPTYKIRNFFTFLYTNEALSFLEKGIIFIDNKVYIPYENIKFKIYLNQYNYYALVMFFENEEYFINGGQIEVNGDLIFWIKEYDLVVENFDLLYEKTFKFTKKYKYRELIENLTKADKLIIPILGGILNLLILSILFDRSLENRVAIVIFLMFLLNPSIYFGMRYTYTRKLIITNIGLTFISNYGSRSRIFIHYDNLLSVIVMGNKIKINGKYAVIEFKNKPKIVKRLSKYIDSKKIKIYT